MTKKQEVVEQCPNNHICCPICKHGVSVNGIVTDILIGFLDRDGAEVFICNRCSIIAQRMDLSLDEKLIVARK
jgi:hypothetical protein